MTRKKSSLSLCRSRRRSHKQPNKSIGDDFVQPKSSPFPRAIKRKLTPLKSPRRQQQFRSPLYKAKRISNRELFEIDDPKEKDNWFSDIISQIEDNKFKSASTQLPPLDVCSVKSDKSTQTADLDAHIPGKSLENCEVDTKKVTNALKDLLEIVVEKMSSQSNLHLTLLSFFEQIKSDIFPLDNIALLLWSDVVRWFDTSNTTNMRYNEDTKLFWKTGWRLFGGRFVNFMAGFKNQSEYSQGLSEKSKYSPRSSKINFAVPDMKVLRSFDRFHCESQRNPGIYNDVINSLGRNVDHMSFCLTFDGKKLKQGLTEHYGDVDLLGFENGLTLMDKRAILQHSTDELSAFSATLQNQCDRSIPLTSLPSDLKAQLKRFLLEMLKMTSLGKHEMEQVRKKKEYAKDKLIERSGNSNWRNGKFSYAISAIIAYIHDIDVFVRKSENTIREICVCVSSLNGRIYAEDRNVDLKSNKAFYSIDQLKNDDDSYSTRLIKQRSDKWFELRSSAKITGSTLYKGLGLDGLKNQKEYFEVQFCGVPQKTQSDFVTQAMKHGEENEINAVATLVNKVLPVIFPNLVYCEEGCVVFHDEQLNPFLVVSPDGSIRKDISMKSTEFAVEIKCPMRDVHFEFPERYLLQCLSEIEALDVKQLLYLSWTETFTSVFLVDRNKALFTKAMQLANSLFGSSKIVLPTKLTSDVKSLKKEIQTYCRAIPFIGLIPSAVVGEPATLSNQIRTVDDVTRLLNTQADIHASKYELKREKATESVVFICADLNRSWNKEISQNAPVAWFTKGYSLDTHTMRNISEEVHTRCHNAGIHIPCQSFDGQWHNIVTRTSDNKPLTVLQLQKDVWREVEQMRKQSIITKFREMNTNPTWVFTQNNGSNILSVSNYMTEIPTVKRAKDSEKTTKGITTQAIDEHYDQERYSIDNSDITSTDTLTEENAEESTQSVITDKDASCLLALLKSDKASNSKGHWDDKGTDNIKETLSMTEKLKSMRDVELRVVVRYFRKTKNLTLNETATKARKLDELSRLLRLSKPEIKKVSSKKQYKTRTLRDLAAKVLSTKVSKQELNCAYSEVIWNARYREWKTKAAVLDNLDINETGVTREWFYHPEYSMIRKQLEVKCIDATHLLTRTRRKCCKGGLDGLSNDAWRKVARTGKTLLTPIMVDEVTDPMSSAMAATHFSENVESEMRQMGEIRSADLCRDIRMWWEAEDCSGLSAIERFKMREGLRKRLLSHVNFSRFPPPTMNVAGWPIQLWEALISHIDAKTLLYALCHSGCYNVRAFSSLIGETFFSELVLHDKTGCGTVTAAEFGRFIGTATEQLHIRHDPDRKFVYRTGRSHVYGLSGSHETTTAEPTNTDVCMACQHNSIIHQILLRDHAFDSPKRQEPKRKLETVSTNRNAIQKGTLGVRWEKARRNDSKMLLTSKMGIDIDP